MIRKITLLFVLIAIAFNGAFASVGSSVCGPVGGPYSAANCTANFDCTSNTSTYNVGGVIYTCNYFDDTYTDRTNVCPYVYTGQHYTQHSVTNCGANPHTAPINSGLIFLLVAGLGLVIYTVRRNQLNAKAIA